MSYPAFDSADYYSVDRDSVDQGSADSAFELEPVVEETDSGCYSAGLYSPLNHFPYLL